MVDVLLENSRGSSNYGCEGKSSNFVSCARAFRRVKITYRGLSKKKSPPLETTFLDHICCGMVLK